MKNPAGRLFEIAGVLALAFVLNAAVAYAGESREFEYLQRLYDDGVYDIAAAQCESFRGQFPDSDRLDEILRIEGDCWFALGRYEEARRACQRLAINHPSSPLAPEALRRVADCLVMLGRRPEAATTLKRVAEYYPRNPLAAPSLLRAEELWDPEDVEARREILDRLIRDWQSSGEALEARRRMAGLYLARGDRERALRELDAVIRLAPDGPVRIRAAVGAADLLALENRVDQALKQVEPLLAAHAGSPERSLLRRTVSALRIRAGAYGEARKDLELWLAEADAELDPPADLDSLRLLLGNARALGGDYDGAAEAYRGILEPGPAALYRLAWCESAGGRREEAFGDWLRVVENIAGRETESFPESELRLLAGALAEMRKLGSGMDHDAVPWARVGEALALLPASRALPLELVDGLLEAGELDAAARLLETAGGESSPLADDFALRRIRLAAARSDYRRAAASTAEFRKRYPLSPLLEHVDEYYRRRILRHAEGAALNERLLDFLVRQNSGENPQLLAYEFGRLYLNSLQDPRQAENQFRLALSGPDDSLCAEARWGLVECAVAEGAEGRAAESARNFLRERPSSVHALEALLLGFVLERGGIDPDMTDLPFSGGRTEAAQEALRAERERLAREIEQLQEFRAARKASRPARARESAGELLERWSRLAELLEDSLEVALAAGRALAWSDTLDLKGGHRPRTMLALGRVREIAGNDSAAARVYRLLVREYSTSPAAVDAELRLAALPGTTDAERLELLERLRRERYYHPAAVPARQMVAGLYSREGRHTEALEIYRRLIAEAERGDPGLEIVPGTAQPLYYNAGVALHELGRGEEARYAFRRYLSGAGRDPRAAEALYRTAGIFHQDGRDGEALRYLKNLLTVFDEDPAIDRALWLMAGIYEEDARFREALAVYERLDAAASADPVLQYRWIRALYRQGRLTQGRERMKTYLRQHRDAVNGDTVKAAFNLAKGRYLSSAGRLDEAEKPLQHVLKYFEDTRFAPLARLELAKVRIAAGDTETALVLLEELGREWPEGEIAARSSLLKGGLFRRAGEVQRAVIEFRRAVDTAPDDETRRFALNNLIVSYRELGFHDGALQAARRYAEEFPEAEDGFSKRIEIGLLLKEIGELDQAAEHLRRLLPEANVEDEAAIQFYIGECRFLKGEYSAAILEYMKVPYLGRATKLDWDVTAIYQAAQCWEQLGEREKAERLYLRIVRERGPGSSYGEAAQERINRLRFLDQDPAEADHD